MANSTKYVDHNDGGNGPNFRGTPCAGIEARKQGA